MDIHNSFIWNPMHGCFTHTAKVDDGNIQFSQKDSIDCETVVKEVSKMFTDYSIGWSVPYEAINELINLCDKFRKYQREQKMLDD